MLDLPPRAAWELRDRLIGRFGEDMFDDFALDHRIREFDTPALIFHDPDDAGAPFQDAEAW